MHLTNNLFVLDRVATYGRTLIDPAFEARNNLVVGYADPSDAGYVDVGFARIAGTTAADVMLVDGKSPAVDAGATVPEGSLDYFNRARPAGAAPDIGALEFGASQARCLPPRVSPWRSGG